MDLENSIAVIQTGNIVYCVNIELTVISVINLYSKSFLFLNVPSVIIQMLLNLNITLIDNVIIMYVLNVYSPE